MVRRVVAAALLVILAATTSASAGEPTDTLRRLFDQANRILLAPHDTDDARLTALRALVRSAFDAGEAAALALGRQWQARTPAERDEFSRLYGDVIEGAYLGGIGSRARVDADGIRVAFEAEWVKGSHATVRTILETRAGAQVPIEYRMTRRDRGWAVVDVVVDGLSLADSYRAQFQRVMRSGTYAVLVDRLREKASTTTLAAIAAARTAAAVVMPAAPPVAVPAPPPTEAATAPASDTPPAASVPSPQKSFWLQVGAFRDPDAASRLVEQLREHRVMVATDGPHAEPLARVLVGPFTNRAAAASARKALAARGYRGFIAFE
jgi:phospholipid transport system substrate-binding protein